MLKGFFSLFEDKFSKENILKQLEVDIASGVGFWSRFNQKDFEIDTRPKVGEDFKSMVLIHLNSAIMEYWLIENNYAEPLLRKQRQLTYVDAYGDENTDDFDNEVKKFLKKRQSSIIMYVHESVPEFYKELAESFSGEHFLYPQDFDDIRVSMSSAIVYVLFDAEEELSESLTDYTEEEITPYEYEALISQRFSNLDWNSTVTSGSGDQGADVLAEKFGVNMVIQCKMYSQPVGNKAVQEVSSARDYYQGDIALVVTNNDYTKSARQLAESQNVYLIHDSQIEEFDSLLFAEES